MYIIDAILKRISVKHYMTTSHVEWINLGIACKELNTCILRAYNDMKYYKSLDRHWSKLRMALDSLLLSEIDEDYMSGVQTVRVFYGRCDNCDKFDAIVHEDISHIILTKWSYVKRCIETCILERKFLHRSYKYVTRVQNCLKAIDNWITHAHHPK